MLRIISHSAPLTRPQLSTALGFSKPTMSAAVGELESHGLLASNGITKGLVGRTAVSYGLGRSAGFSIGVDCGTTQILGLGARLDGQRVAEFRGSVMEEAGQPSDRGRFQAIGAAIAEMVASVGEKAGPLRSIAIALPNIISQQLDRLPGRRDFLEVLQDLKGTYDVPILLENNVNCAALAEVHGGAAKGHPFAVYLQVGVKIGIGIVLEGKLFRGYRGGAGEVGHFPFPWSTDEAPQPLHLETYLGSAQLLQRCREHWPASDGPSPRTPNELFERAERSDYARACVEKHARDIGKLLAGCVSVLDPELVVVGGGVGQNAMLLPGIRAVVEEICWPVEIVTSTLSGQATVLGAVGLATDFAMASLVGETGSAGFLYPGALTADLLDS